MQKEIYHALKLGHFQLLVPGAQGGLKSWGDTHGERVEREPKLESEGGALSGVQWGPGAKSLVRESGGLRPLKLTVFLPLQIKFLLEKMTAFNKTDAQSLL